MTRPAVLAPRGTAQGAAQRRVRRWLATPALAALLAGCGYAMESPRLPNDRQTIAVAPVRNRTYEAELDVRLQQELRRRFFRDAAIRVGTPERSDLVLTVELERLLLTRARDLATFEVLALTYQLTGVITLRDAVSGDLILDRQPVGVIAVYSLTEATLETPAVRDEALHDVIAAFADAVMSRLLLN